MKCVTNIIMHIFSGVIKFLAPQFWVSLKFKSSNCLSPFSHASLFIIMWVEPSLDDIMFTCMLYDTLESLIIVLLNLVKICLINRSNLYIYYCSFNPVLSLIGTGVLNPTQVHLNVNGVYRPFPSVIHSSFSLYCIIFHWVTIHVYSLVSFHCLCRQMEKGQSSVEVNPLAVFHSAMSNARPVMGTTKVIRGGKGYHVCYVIYSSVQY